MQRRCGILLPIFSLPSEYGIGGFGSEAFRFIDYLKKAGQSYWQILPLAPTGYGNSPYSSVAAEIISPYYISPEVLKDKGLVTEEEIAFSRYGGKLNAAELSGYLLKTERIAESGAGSVPNGDVCALVKYVDYGFLNEVRFPLLRKAFARFDRGTHAFARAVKEKKYRDYALFKAIKYASGNREMTEWDEGLKFRKEAALKSFEKDYAEEIAFWEFTAFEAEEEWLKVKRYANEKGIKIIGDMPLYVAGDSVDVWKDPNLFMLDEDLKPRLVAGVPPDYFQKEGQLWGNPVYDYAAHERDGFSWWVNRITKALSLFDVVRIDHFRGLDRFFAIKAGEKGAKGGEWIDVPSEKLFAAIKKSVPDDCVIAEDLGIIDDGVRELLKATGYPGMKILSFAFNGESDNLYLPENIEANSVCYTGTHDNDTLIGLIRTASDWDFNNLTRGVKNSAKTLFGEERLFKSDEELADTICELGFACAADTFILPMQDVLKKGGEYRVNEPGTVKPQNWAVRFEEKDFSEDSAKFLKNLAVKYKRV